jgi:hypothetical protein
MSEDLDRYVEHLARRTSEPLAREVELGDQYPEDRDRHEALLRVACILAAALERKGPKAGETLGAYTEALAAQVDGDLKRLRCACNFYKNALAAFCEYLARTEGSSVARVLGGHEYKTAREAAGLPERKRCGCSACQPAKEATS